jgi:hypothetical protein
MPLKITARFAVLALLLSTAASAAELCVVCAAPVASYRCSLATDATDATVTAVSDAALQMQCIRDLATRGGHESCSIDRTRAGQPCDGPVALVTKPSGLPPSPADGFATTPGTAAAAAPTSVTPADGAAPMPRVTAPTASPAPPKTVEELAKMAAAQSKADWEATHANIKSSSQAAQKQLEQAGSSAGSAMKKSWDCVISLFSRCQ